MAKQESARAKAAREERARLAEENRRRVEGQSATPASPVSSAFVLADELDDLTYDFRPYVADAHGVIPEPSTAQISAFQKAVRDIIGPIAARVMNADPESALKALADATTGDDAAMAAAQETAKLNEAMMFAAIADLCGGKPSLEEIKALPFRGQRAFAGWLTGLFLNPNR